jgi:type IV secretory pathway protease TraF
MLKADSWPVTGPRVVALSGVGLMLAILLLPEVVSLFLLINLTPSLPRGLYRVTRLEVQPGALVTFCLPAELLRRHDLSRWMAPGRCPGGKSPLCKRIVVVGRGRARCEGALWQVGEDEVFVRGDSERSQDSCVFGPVPVAWLRDGVVPLWTL